MINLSIPILKIKTSGFNLLDIKTINITIINKKEIINKGISEIEIDNDTIIVFLGQEESESLKENTAIISISATDQNNVDVSSRIRTVWVKKGSRSNAYAEANFVRQDVFDQTIYDIGIKIEDLENGLSVGGNRVYLDYRDGKYGVNTDPERGADTFTPFKSGEGELESPIVIQIKFSGNHIRYANTLDQRSYFPAGIQMMIKKIVIKSLTIKRKNRTANNGSVGFYFRIYGYKQEGTAESALYSEYWETYFNRTDELKNYVNDKEINTSSYLQTTSFGVWSYGGGSALGSVVADYDFYGIMEVYF